MRSSEVARGVRAASIVEEAQAALDAVLGDDAPHVKVRGYKNGVLKLHCDRSIYAETVRLRAQELIEAVNAHFGREAIDTIVTV